MRPFRIFAAVAGVITIGGSAIVVAIPADAAQSYACMCDGKRRQFRASTRYCEHQFNVPQCSEGQYTMVYNAACQKMGCSLPTEEDDAKVTGDKEED